MKNTKRIKKLLESLEFVWSKVPDLRFLQLLDYIAKGNIEDDVYYIEDETLQKNIDKLTEELQQQLRVKYE